MSERTSRDQSVDQEPQRERCGSVRRTDAWPYIQRCIREERHVGPHRGHNGKEWEDPTEYLGVKVPETLLPNWDQVEGEWWRIGVRAAIKHYEGKS